MFQLWMNKERMRRYFHLHNGTIVCLQLVFILYSIIRICTILSSMISGWGRSSSCGSISTSSGSTPVVVLNIRIKMLTHLCVLSKAFPSNRLGMWLFNCSHHYVLKGIAKTSAESFIFNKTGRGWNPKWHVLLAGRKESGKSQCVSGTKWSTLGKSACCLGDHQTVWRGPGAGIILLPDHFPWCIYSSFHQSKILISLQTSSQQLRFS